MADGAAGGVIAGIIDEVLPPGITETIAVTLSADGVPNAAPMGVVRQAERLFIRMFPGSRTYRNVAETGRLVACIVADPVVFVASAFGDLEDDDFVPQKDMPPLIKGSYAYVDCRAEMDGVVRLTPLKCEVLARKVPAYSRGFAAVIDAAVAGTRLRFLGEEGKKRIREDAALARKCGTPRDIEAMNKLLKILDLQG